MSNNNDQKDDAFGEDEVAFNHSFSNTFDLLICSCKSPSLALLPVPCRHCVLHTSERAINGARNNNQRLCISSSRWGSGGLLSSLCTCEGARSHAVPSEIRAVPRRSNFKYPKYCVSK